MAVVVLGGLLTSTLLNIYIIPIVYELIEKENRKMNKLITGILSLAVSVSAAAQGGYSPVLQQIEANNTSLIALQREMEAQKNGKSHEVFSQLIRKQSSTIFGAIGTPGNRTDFSVKQVIDFPTAYSYRSKIANLQNANTEIAYKSGRIDLLLAAKQIYMPWRCCGHLSVATATALKPRLAAAAYLCNRRMGVFS